MLLRICITSIDTCILSLACAHTQHTNTQTCTHSYKNSFTACRSTPDSCQTENSKLYKLLQHTCLLHIIEVCFRTLLRHIIHFRVVPFGSCWGHLWHAHGTGCLGVTKTAGRNVPRCCNIPIKMSAIICYHCTLNDLYNRKNCSI